MDHSRDFPDFVASGIFGWLYGGWAHSSPAGRCHHRRGDPGDSGKKMIIAIRTRDPGKEGEQFL